MKNLTLAFISFILTFSVIQAQWVQIGQNIYGDSEYGYSGSSVSLNSNGSFVAIGTPENDGGGSGDGLVRTYQNVNDNWSQIGQDIVGEQNYCELGTSVSMNSDGSVVAIGIPYFTGDGGDMPNEGVVCIYQYYNEGWIRIGDSIFGVNAFDYCGSSVSINSDGDIVAIGSPWNCGNGTSSDAGQVRVFMNNGGSWTQFGQDINGDDGDLCGSSISLSASGYVVAIGSYAHDESTGRVRVYENLGGSWTQIGEDFVGDAPGDFLGWSVSLSADGDYVAMGAFGNDVNGTDAGLARIYYFSVNSWLQVGQDIYGESGDESGRSISLNEDGSVVAVGAPYYSSEKGRVRVYQNINGDWVQFGEDIEGETAYEESGESVSLSYDGSVVAVGAPYNSTNAINQGVVRVYNNPFTDISDFSNSEVSVYPNPTKGLVHIESSTLKAKTITVSSITNKTVIEKEITGKNESIDLSDFEKGVYILRIQMNGKTITTRIIKE